jgi:hypothetical protein
LILLAGVSRAPLDQRLRASEERANSRRADTAQQMGASQQPTVERNEVAVFET